MNTEIPERFEGCAQELLFSLTAKPDGPHLPDAELSFSLVKIADRVEILTAFLRVPSNDVEGDDILLSAAVCMTMRRWGDIKLSISSRAAKFAQQTEELRTFMQKTFSSSRQRKWEEYCHEDQTDQAAWM